MLMKFLADAEYNGKIIYKAGQTVEVPDENGFSWRWVRRGIALPVEKTEDSLEGEKKTSAPGVDVESLDQIEVVADDSGKKKSKPRKPKSSQQSFDL